MSHLTSLSKVLLAELLLTSVCAAANVRDHLVSVQHSSLHFSFPLRVKQVQGSGICISRNCSVVATPYHIQMLAGKTNLGVAGGHTEKVLSLASETDTNRTDVPVAKQTTTLFYNVAHDVSFVYTKKPVPHKSGVAFSYNFHVGQKVEVAGYRNHKFETTEARIIGSNVPLVMGKARLSENLVVDVYLNPGASGSAVLDERGNLLGMIVLTGAAKLRGGDLTASIALPVRTIATALVRLDPALGSAIFNDVPREDPRPEERRPAAYEEDDLPEDTTPVVPELSAAPTAVPSAVDKLRATSLAASRLAVNFITKQCLAQGTEKPLCHELSIVGGEQSFRKIGHDDKLGEPTESFPIQKHGVWVQSDWTDTSGEIADNPWVFQGSADDSYLFTSKAAAEDDRCYFEEYPQGIPLFSGWHPDWKGSVACFKQVLTDKDFNVVSVFTEMRPPDGCLTELFQTAIYYDWIRLEGLKSPVLLPVRERITAKVRGRKDLLYGNVSWTDYKKFRVGHRIKF